MPKKNRATAAQKARQRQAATGEKYTTALRAETRAAAQRPAVVHAMFSAEGAGWAPIIQRAERALDEVWPGHPAPHWEEKFGDLCWKGAPWSQGPEVWAVVNQATREAASTCQTCPSPGRKRVVVVGLDWGGMPWVKTCCDACYSVPPSHVWHPFLKTEYQQLVERYENRS
ncbi:hypothetical protein [Streptomyces violarus]|uniref:hypothetical protein n=1 Tax=Streptomyces violarus TaxID=67380 RepID=UPI0021C20A48|nr:hypothetical protein [Streptomyces violarus]MCT9141719.1 hypothetical protein [Streptomyces violarus]